MLEIFSLVGVIGVYILVKLVLWYFLCSVFIYFWGIRKETFKLSFEGGAIGSWEGERERSLGKLTCEDVE